MTTTPAMIATALGRPAPEPGSTADLQWSMWVADAEMLVQTRAAQLHMEALPIDQAKLDYVVREAVAAHVRRPDDATQVTIAVDNGSTSKTYRSGKGRITIQDEWWTLLGLTAPSGAFAVDTAPNVKRTDPIRAFLTAADATW